MMCLDEIGRDSGDWGGQESECVYVCMYLFQATRSNALRPSFRSEAGHNNKRAPCGRPRFEHPIHDQGYMRSYFLQADPE